MSRHPADFFDGETIEMIQRCSLEAEGMKRLHPAQLALIQKNNWFRAFIPKRNGGLGLTLPEVLTLEEGLAYADGSMGWVVTLCSGAGWFVGFVDPETAGEFFGGEDVCIAGSGAVAGVAELAGDGYMINGLWKYASGALHATAFTANCHVRSNGEPVLNADGSPKVSTFIFRRKEVIIHETWRSMGMVATGSHSFEVNNLHIPSSRCFYIDPMCAVSDDPVYRYPFLQLAETTLAVNMSGMAVRFIELVSLIVKDRLTDESSVDKAIAILDESRRIFFRDVDASWYSLIKENRISSELLLRVSEVSHNLVLACRKVVSGLYPKCGLAATAFDSEINRVWRNFYTAGQHALFRL